MAGEPPQRPHRQQPAGGKSGDGDLGPQPRGQSQGTEGQGEGRQHPGGGRRSEVGQDQCGGAQQPEVDGEDGAGSAQDQPGTVQGSADSDLAGGVGGGG